MVARLLAVLTMMILSAVLIAFVRMSDIHVILLILVFGVAGAARGVIELA